MHSFKKSAVLLLCIVISFSPVSAQNNTDTIKQFSAIQLTEDFQLLKDTLKKIHAGIYRYSTGVEVDKRFDSCAKTIKDGMNLAQFFALTQYALAALKDGHTNCRLSPQAMKNYQENVKLFPAMVLFIHQHAYIYCCKQNNSLAEAEILSINKQPMDRIIDHMFNYLCSDGGIVSRKNWEMPENFYLMFNTLYGIRENFVVEYKSKTGITGTTTLHADFMKNIFCNNPFPRPVKYLQLSYPAKNTALLTLKSFFNGFLDQTGEHFSEFLDSAFRDINEKKITRLLIDMRSNQGGNDDNGIILYSHLTRQPFAYYAAKQTSTKKFGGQDDQDLGIKQPSSIRFNGKAYLLMNGRSFSGVAEFAAVFRSNHRGILLGEECGGGYYGNTSGNDVNVVLPNTGISVRVPLVKYTMAVKRLPAGVQGMLPDYPIYTSITDIVEKTDGQLASALKIAAKN